jgi:hypothetical protein
MIGKLFLWCVLVPFAVLMLISFGKAVQGALQAERELKATLHKLKKEDKA